MISRFHEFLNQIFDRVLRFGPTVRWRRRVRGGVQSTTTINARGKSSGDVRGSYIVYASAYLSIQPASPIPSSDKDLLI